MSTHGRPIPFTTRLSHLALWPACYTPGVYLLSVLALETDPPGAATVGYLLLVGHACYLLDRVKLSDSRQDPADAVALPERAMLYAQRARVFRWVLTLELLAAIVLGAGISPLLGLLPIGAVLGVHLYAGRGASPGRPRFKDLPSLKSFFIATAYLALVIAVLWGNALHPFGEPDARVGVALAGLWLIVCGDAILCDLDDRPSDAFYGTRSLPVLLGHGDAWIVAQLMLMTGIALIVIPHPDPYLMLGVGLALWLSTLPTLHMKNRRDLVDARLLPVVLLALLVR